MLLYLPLGKSQRYNKNQSISTLQAQYILILGHFQHSEEFQTKIRPDFTPFQKKMNHLRHLPPTPDFRNFPCQCSRPCRDDCDFITSLEPRRLFMIFDLTSPEDFHPLGYVRAGRVPK